MAAICHYCGKLVIDDVLSKNQTVHTRCAKERPPGFAYECGTYKIELYPELMTQKQIKKIIRNLPMKG